MKIEDQVVSLDTAKRLREIGVNNRSLFAWQYNKYNEENASAFYLPAESITCPPEAKYQICHAYTASEIFDMLPGYIMTNENGVWSEFQIEISKADIAKEIGATAERAYRASYNCYSSEDDEPLTGRRLFSYKYHENLAECLAQLLIAVHEGGYSE